MKYLWEEAPNPIPPGLPEAFEAATGKYVAITPTGLETDDIGALISFSFTYDPDEYCRRTKKAEAAAKRAEVIADGFTTSKGIPLWTDEKSISSLTTLSHIARGSPPDRTFSLKGSDGKFYRMTAPDVVNAVDEVLAFQQRCFDHERRLCDLIDASPVWQAVQEIDATAGFLDEGAS